MHFAHALGQRLAFFARQLLAQFCLARDQLVTDRHEHAPAFLQPLRPGGLGGGHRRDGPVDLIGVRLRIASHHVFGVGGAAIDDAGSALDQAPLM